MSLNCFAYKEPFSNKISFGKSNHNLASFHKQSFVISSFDIKNPSIISIPATINYDTAGLIDLFECLSKELDDSNDRLFIFPQKSTSKEEYATALTSIIEAIKLKKISKCVSARASIFYEKIDIYSTFQRLCNLYPSSFVFLFHTPQTGTWIGASPELLLSKEKESIISTALAGTHKSGAKQDWSLKEMEEHKIVSEYIGEVFDKHGINYLVQPTIVRQAGPVEHLQTILSGKVNANFQITKFLKDLSPTPALAGHPRNIAMDLIKQTESFQRGFYGGYCGYVNNNYDMDLYVNLRSMQVEKEKYCIFAGGGIMVNSDINEEWLETEHKSATLRNAIVYQNKN